MKLSNYQRAVIISFVDMFTVSYCNTYLFSYFPEMTLYFGYEEQSKGYYSGITAAVYSIGLLLTGYIFGRLSDRHGHNKMLIILHVSNAVFSLITGFCLNIYLVITLRFLSGLCGPISCISRALLFIHSDESNQFIAMASNQAAWSIGLITGTTLGGFLSSPTIKYPHVFGQSGFLATYPFLIPPMIAFVLNITSALLTYALYPTEVNSADDYISVEEGEVDSEDTQTIHLKEFFRTTAQYASADILDETRSQTVSLNSKVIDSVDDRNMDETMDESENQDDGENPTSVCTLLKNTNLVKACVVYSLISASDAYLEITAVWSSTDRDVGGLGYTSSKIGTVFTIIIIPITVIQLIIFPSIQKRLGSIKSAMLFLATGMCAMTLTPISRALHDRQLQWGVLIIFQFLTIVCDVGSCTTTFVILHNTVAKNQAGVANGFASMFKATVACLGPIIGGAVFAASITSDIGPPIDYNLAFVVVGSGLFIGSVITYTLPDYLNFAFCDLQ